MHVYVSSLPVQVPEKGGQRWGGKERGTKKKKKKAKEKTGATQLWVWAKDCSEKSEKRGKEEE